MEDIHNQKKVSLKLTGRMILFFFFLSGAVGLIYEIIWTRLLRLIMGNTVFSITTVLCAFMGGLALGGFWGGKIIDRRNDPLRIYAFLEGAIGIYALFLPGIIKATEFLYRPIYQNYHTSFYLFSLVRFFFCGILLLLPTTLMGATLPVLTKFFVRSSDQIGGEVGKLYAVNTFGAVLGSFSAGFLLVPVLGVSKTIILAAAINLFICFWVYFLHQRLFLRQEKAAKTPIGLEEKKEGIPIRATSSDDFGFLSRNLPKVLLIGFALSGFAALVYEIAWTRILSLIIGSSTYAFSLMLTAFILGLALGSALFSRFINRRKDPVLFLAVIELLIGLSALAVVPFFGWLPLFIIRIISQFSHSFWLLQLVEFGLVFLLMLIPTTMMGAAFPLVSHIYTRTMKSVGSSVGKVYAANTSGAILGSFIGAFVLIPWLGIQKTILAAVLINILVGCCFFCLCRSVGRTSKGLIAAGIIIGFILTTVLFPSWSQDLISSGAYLSSRINKSADVTGAAFEGELKKLKILYHNEGVSGTITVKEDAQGDRYLLVNGKGDASTSEDMPTQELLAHVPMLLHPNPQDALVIGLASGVTLGSAGLYPLEHLHCVEIAPEAVKACRYFDHVNYCILDDPRVELIIEDGRNHLALTNRTYDVIISEPSNPWIAGISDLFTREFFRLCRQRLNPHGVVCIWLHAYNIEDTIFRSIIHTFHTEFPFCSIWESWGGVDYFLIGSGEKITLDYNRLVNILRDEGISRDLKRIHINHEVDFLSHFVMDEEKIKDYVQEEGVRLHTDDNSLVEFSAPRDLYKKDIQMPLEALDTFREESLPFLFYSGEDKEEFTRVTERVISLIKAKKHITRGKIYYTQGDHNSAIAEFEKAISLDTEDLSTMEKYVEFLATLYLRQGLYNQAMRILEKALAIRSDNISAMITMGKILIHLNEHHKAEQLFQHVLSLDAGYAGAYLQLSYLYLLQRRFHEALSSVNRLLAFQPENPQACYYLGKIYKALGQTEEAIAALQKGIDLQPTLSIIRLELGNIYFERGDFTRAQKIWQKALTRENVDLPTHLVNLGTQYFRSGVYDRAIEAWLKAAELKPENHQIHYNIALAYCQLRQFKAAVEELQEILRVKPDDQAAALLLQRIE